MGEIAFQITNLTIVYSTVYSDADQRKHQSSASLAFVRGHRVCGVCVCWGGGGVKFEWYVHDVWGGGQIWVIRPWRMKFFLTYA